MPTDRDWMQHRSVFGSHLPRTWTWRGYSQQTSREVILLSFENLNNYHSSVPSYLLQELESVRSLYYGLLEADLNASNYVIVCTVMWVNYSCRHRVIFLNLSEVWPTSKTKSWRYFQTYLFKIYNFSNKQSVNGFVEMDSVIRCLCQNLYGNYERCFTFNGLGVCWHWCFGICNNYSM